MLLSVVIHLQAERDAAPLPRGRAVHAWFLQQVAQRDPALASFLHQGDGNVRPFTVSDVRWQWDAFSSKGLPILAGKRYGIRITSIMPELSHLLIQDLMPHLPPRLDLAGASFRVVEAIDRGEKHPWAGRATFQSLWHQAASSAATHFELVFGSPTTFRSQGVFVPVPWPRLVFHGLIKKWNLFAEIPLPQDVLDVLASSLAIRGYALQATGIPLDRHGQVKTPAFWGRCSYAVVSKDRPMQRLARALAAFALFAGVGRETSRGFGQCRMEVSDSKQ